MKNKSLVLLSGEGSTIPQAESRALFLAYDSASRFESPEPRILIADSSADPFQIGSRVAFGRRVGRVPDGRSELKELVVGRRVRFSCFRLSDQRGSPDPGEYLDGLRVTVDLRTPELEVTLIRGREDYLAVTSPRTMNQGWSRRRPRQRPFFHPSAIFPKLSRALVNLSRAREGEVFLDPFAGTGSILLEAGQIGARVVGVDLSRLMVLGAKLNMKHFGQDWLGLIRADSTSLPLRSVSAMATDVPYGRASSTGGRGSEEIISLVLPSLASAVVPHSYLVLMHPQEKPVAESRELSVLEEHHLQVHKRLTRTITVLERR